MAASLFKSNLLSPSSADLSLAISRCYATASHGSRISGLSRGGSRSDTMGKELKAAIKEGSDGDSSAWAPDPLTGYYRPQNHADEVDPVELREMLLNNEVRRPR